MHQNKMHQNRMRHFGKLFINGYSCTNSKSRDSRRELSNSRRELSISLLEFRNSRLYPIYNSQKQTRITYFSVEKTIKKTAILVVRISRLHENYFSLDKRDIQISVNPWFSSSVILVYTRITFLLAIEKQQISVSRELLFSTREKVNFSLFSIPLDIPVLHTIYFLAPVTTPYSTPPRDPSNAFLSHPLAAPWCYINPWRVLCLCLWSNQPRPPPSPPPVWVFHGNPHFIVGKCIYNRRNEFYAWAHSKNIGRLANKKCNFPLQFRPFFPQDSGPSGYFWSCRYDIGTLPLSLSPRFG